LASKSEFYDSSVVVVLVITVKPHLGSLKIPRTHAQVLLDKTGAPDNLWLLFTCPSSKCKSSTKLENSRTGIKGGTPDKSHILMFYWFEPVFYLDKVSKFQYLETTERPGHFAGFADNVGDALTFKILKNDLATILHRSVARSAADVSHRNIRVSFKSDVQESLKLLDAKPSLSFVWKGNHHKHKSRRTNNDVSNRTRSKADYTNQNVGSRTRSKMHNINVNDLSVQNLFFLLHDAILFQGNGKSQAQDLQLGVLECKVYHSILMNTKYQVDFDCLLQLHMLCNTEEDNDMS
jgi:hypothetical protein